MRFKVLALLALVANAPLLPATAWDGEKVQTVSGLLRIDEVDSHDVMRVEDVVIPIEGVRAHIVSVIPKKGKAEFVIYYVWNGGNCCPNEYFLLDAGAKTLRPISVSNWNYSDPKILFYKSGLVRIAQIASERTMLGDAIWEILEYKRGYDDFAVVRHSAVNDYKKFVGKWTDDFLDDAKARYSLVELMGAKDFATFREYVGEFGKKTIMVEGRFLVGEGHGRGTGLNWRYSVFIIDTFFDQAWALERDDHITDGDADPGIKYKAWGHLEESETAVRGILDAWLHPFGKEIAYKAGPIEIADAGLMPAPPPPSWHPRLPDTMQPY